MCVKTRFPVAMATIAKFGCTVAYTVVFLMVLRYEREKIYKN